MAVTYHPLEPADIAAVTGLFEAEGELSPYAGEALADERLAGWVAREGGQIVAAVLTRRMRSDDGAERGGIDELLVASANRGQGIGRRLMTLAEVEYRTSNLAGMQLTVTKTNVPALRLYEDLGYAVVKRYLRPARTDPARSETRLRMWKDFR